MYVDKLLDNALTMHVWERTCRLVLELETADRSTTNWLLKNYLL